jgi:hypothetical protein
MTRKEIFTKSGLVDHFGQAFRKLLYPTESSTYSHDDFLVIEKLKRQFVDMLADVKSTKLNKSSHVEILYSENGSNLIDYQCRGLVIDIAEERVLHWGYQDLPCALPAGLCTWVPVSLPTPGGHYFNVVLFGAKVSLVEEKAFVPEKLAARYLDQLQIQPLLELSASWYLTLFFGEDNTAPKLYSARSRLTNLIARHDEFANISSLLHLDSVGPRS